MAKPKKRPQQSLDNADEYKRQRAVFEGSPEIVSHAVTQEYRQGWERIWGKGNSHGRPQ